VCVCVCVCVLSAGEATQGELPIGSMPAAAPVTSSS